MFNIPKARGKRMDTKQWVYGYAMIRHDNVAMIFVPESCNTYIVDPNTLGLEGNSTDISGHTVYEGDTILYANEKYTVSQTGNIRLCIKTSRDSEIPLDELSGKFEIIGNVYP